MLKFGVISVDTNFLLNLYRFSQKTQKLCFDVLDCAADRLWLSNQVAEEYLKNYPAQITSQISTYESALQLFEKLPNQIDSLQEHPFIDHPKLLKAVKDSSSKLVALLEKHAEEILGAGKVHENYKKEALRVHERITTLFKDCVGDPFSASERAQIEKSIQDRYSKNIPPGFLDRKKKNNNEFGDAVIWLQYIKHLKEIPAKSKPKHAIFVTNEEDRDWWWLEDEQRTATKLGPHPMLISEMLAEANVKFYLYSGTQFLRRMGKLYSLELDKETAKEIESVSRESHQPVRLTAVELFTASEESKKRGTLWMNIQVVAEKIAALTSIPIDTANLVPNLFDDHIENLFIMGFASRSDMEDLTILMQIVIKALLMKSPGSDELDYAIRAVKKALHILMEIKLRHGKQP